MERSDPIQQEVETGDLERSGRRFAADMKALREGRGVSLDAIRRETRVAEGVLDEFEVTGLATNQIFNRVYLRSLVISYAKVVGLDQSTCLSALEAALAGTYDGQLTAAVDDTVAHAATVEPASDDHPPTGSIEDSEERGVQAQHDAGIEPSHAEDRPATIDLAAEAAGNFDEGGLPDQLGAESDSTLRDSRPTTVRDADGSAGERRTDLADRLASRFVFISTDEQARASKSPSRTSNPRLKTEISTAVHDFRPPEDQKGVIVAPNRFRAVALGSLAIIVSVTALVMAIRLSGRSEPVDSSGGAEAAETSVMPGTEIGILPPDPIPPVPAVTIGDSITVTLVAAGGPLDPVRVQVDADLRRPFWVDEGDSLSFRISRRIAIQDLLARLSIRVEGVPYPTDSYADPDRVIITRDSVESFVRSMASR
ncbi:MAG: helix-turn-helix domain-containing protein [Rhodothermales bacterium]|nr:helix-turn-helix domain-containing protein [Rhodothermales bacterium]